MNRFVLVPALALVVVIVAVPSQACAQALPPPGSYPGCPEYDVLNAGSDGARLAVDSYGRFLLDVQGQYLAWDEPSLYGAGDYLFAVWLYSESNGLPGLQRGDELCDNTPEGAWPDALWC